MDMHFIQDDLEKWARFSGDYNPIHFDEHFAVEEVGLGGVVVHGMLAMMPLKGPVSQVNWGGDGWVRWSALLKRAIPLKSSYAISIDPPNPNEKTRFSLSERGGAAKNIIGSCSTVDFDASEYPSTPLYYIGGTQVKTKLHEFRESYPDIDGMWVFLDALMFSEWIAKHSRTMFQEELFEHYGVDIGANDSSQQLMVMHTNHALIATTSLVGRPLRDGPQMVGYNIVKKDRVITKDAVFALIAIPVWVDGILEMVIEMGLMAKKKV